MAASSTFTNLIKQIRNAIYGKDVREAIANAIEICYDSSSGDVALDAADRANQAAANAEQVTNGTADALSALERGLADFDSVVEINDEQPTSPQNKIWVQPQDNTEYRIATYDAYRMLWDEMRDINNTYAQGHGGVDTIVQDEDFVDPEDELKRRYVVHYSDQTTSEFFVKDGQTGPVGPLDRITGTAIYYHKGVMNNGAFVPTPPADGWTSSVPSMNAGDYLWTQTIISYSSGAEAYLYGLTRWGNNGRDGIDGTGAVNSVRLSAGGERLIGDILLPVDSEPSPDSGNLVSSGGVYTAIQSLAPQNSPAFTGMPTAPTASSGNSSSQIATTQFVADSLLRSSPRKVRITMATNTVTYLDSSITADTYCMFSYISTATPFSLLGWKTEPGKLTLTADRTPSSETAFEVILIETAYVT